MKLFSHNAKPDGLPEHEIAECADQIMEMTEPKANAVITFWSRQMSEADMERLFAKLRERGYNIDYVRNKGDNASATAQELVRLDHVDEEEALAAVEDALELLAYCQLPGSVYEDLVRVATTLVNSAPDSVAADVAWAVGEHQGVSDTSNPIIAGITDPNRAAIASSAARITLEAACQPEGTTRKGLKHILAFLAQINGLRHPAEYVGRSKPVSPLMDVW